MRELARYTSYLFSLIVRCLSAICFSVSNKVLSLSKLTTELSESAIRVSGGNICYLSLPDNSMETPKFGWYLHDNTDRMWSLSRVCCAGQSVSDLFVFDVACWYWWWPVNNRDNYDTNTMRFLLSCPGRPSSALRTEIWSDILIPLILSRLLSPSPAGIINMTRSYLAWQCIVSVLSTNICWLVTLPNHQTRFRAISQRDNENYSRSIELNWPDQTKGRTPPEGRLSLPRASWWTLQWNIPESRTVTTELHSPCWDNSSPTLELGLTSHWQH